MLRTDAMRATLGFPRSVVSSTVRDATSDCTRPRRTLAGLVVALLAPVAAVAALATPQLVAVAVLSAVVTLTVRGRAAAGTDRR